MDFIAALPTLDPTWTAPMAVVRQIADGFWGEPGNGTWPRLWLILNNIARSEGVSGFGLACEVTVCSKGGYSRRSYTFRRGEREPWVDITDQPNHEPSDRFGWPLAVYMGTTG